MIEIENAVVYHGSNLDILPTLPDNSVDAIVTDPPYELGFMGKKWDSSGIAYSVELWAECLRVLKPGGHLLAFSGSRTYHRMTVAIEDAGFEIRDMISWISNKTFPKSHNISKAIDKAAGVEREVIGVNQNVVRAAKIAGGSDFGGFTKANAEITAAATDEAKKWDGWGTALKPTVEPIVMARKPFDGTIADNVLEWGVGGLNIDASRIPLDDGVNLDAVQRKGATNPIQFGGAKAGDVISMYKADGRWPANIILDEYTAGLLDEQSGASKSPKPYRAEGYKDSSMFGVGGVNHDKEYGDSGGASRFFYVAKASKKDRNEGLEELPEVSAGIGDTRPSGDFNQRLGTNEKPAQPRQNFHPTVKPTALMEYLIKLVTPAGGTVLDPFTGSGSTGKAALLNGYKFIGCELTEEYLPIIEGRLKHAAEQYASKATEEETKEQETLF